MPPPRGGELAPPPESSPPRRPRGRPPRISREQIAQAAHDIGIADLTLRAVADRLGVSIAGLYHHIDGKDDLLRLAAEEGLARVALPDDRGQHWAVWLAEWARYTRNVFVAEPAMLDRYLDGAISPEVVAERTDHIVSVLLRHGFTVEEAMVSYELVSTMALGAAVAGVRARRAEERGTTLLAAQQEVLARREDDDLPALRAVVAASADRSAESFEHRIATLLRGIALDRGVPDAEVTEALAAQGFA